MVVPRKANNGRSCDGCWLWLRNEALQSLLNPRRLALFSFMIGALYIRSITVHFEDQQYDTNVHVDVQVPLNAHGSADNDVNNAVRDVGKQRINANNITTMTVAPRSGSSQSATATTTTTTRQESTQNITILAENTPYVWTATKDTQFEVCFVTSVYASSVRTGDRPPDVTDIVKDNPSFAFFAFTNLPDLVAPGWQILVKPSLSYRRDITKSRWPKFMAWQEPLIQKCQAVFYMDGFCGPKAKHSERYKRLARSIPTSEFGLFQNVHDVATGPMHELDRIVDLRKDIAKNVEASKAWLRAQPDFSDNCTMYANHYIAYDPKSKHFQKAARFFWDRYSLEEDSWRDQPLWCYVLDHFQITPTRLGTFEALFRDYFGRMGHGGHRYTDNAGGIISMNTTDHSSGVGQSRVDTTKDDNTPAAEACFVTASYSTSPENADRPPGVRKILEANPTFRFYVFTNLPDLDAPGWTILTERNNNNNNNNSTAAQQKYKRHITQSRWPKFLGWKHPTIQKNCPAVFYQDAYCRPREKFAKTFKTIARQLSESEPGFAQDLHEWGMGPMAEFDRILEKGKDTPSNVLASRTWLRSQPDFNENCTLYSNQYLAYDPTSVAFQRASQFFWDRYSLEEDSWRDQPLWCYVLDKFKVTPSDFGSFKTMFKEHKSRMSPDNHRYVVDGGQ